MFNFLNMAGNYNDRKVDRYDDPNSNLFISTAEVNDGNQPFETAICSEFYNDNNHVIVEAYNTREQAQIGHDKWVRIMTTTEPESLTDCKNSSLFEIFGEEDEEFVYYRKK